MACSDKNNNTTGVGGTSSGGGSTLSGGAPTYESGGSGGTAYESGGSGSIVRNESGGSGGTVTSESGRSSSSGVGGATAGDAALELSDMQIVQVLITANDGEITVGTQASAKAQSTRVKSFAQMMVADHTSSQQQVQSLAASKGLSPQASVESQRLEASTASVLNQLNATPTSGYDVAYMQSQIAMHQQVLALLDTQLIPYATNPDLDALLEKVRTTVADHLAQAQQIAAGL